MKETADRFGSATAPVVRSAVVECERGFGWWAVAGGGGGPPRSLHQSSQVVATGEPARNRRIDPHSGGQQRFDSLPIATLGRRQQRLRRRHPAPAGRAQPLSNNAPSVR